MRARTRSIPIFTFGFTLFMALAALAQEKKLERYDCFSGTALLPSGRLGTTAQLQQKRTSSPSLSLWASIAAFTSSARQ